MNDRYDANPWNLTDSITKAPETLASLRQAQSIRMGQGSNAYNRWRDARGRQQATKAAIQQAKRQLRRAHAADVHRSMFSECLAGMAWAGRR